MVSSAHLQLNSFLELQILETAYLCNQQWVIFYSIYYIVGYLFWESSCCHWSEEHWILLDTLIGMNSAMSSTQVRFCQNIHLFRNLKIPMCKTIPVTFLCLL